MTKKILLVTGASSDIGKELLKEIIDEYDIIWVHCFKIKDELVKLQNHYGNKIKLIVADFKQCKSVQKMINEIIESELIPNHIIHLAACKISYCKFHKITWEKFEDEINVSLRSITLILQAIIPYMAKKKSGKIIFMLTSGVTNIPPKYMSSYITIKYALMGLAKTLSTEYADKGILVNAVSPDMINTKFLENISEHVIEKKIDNSPMKRILDVEDVIPTIIYLLSEGANSITGVNIEITAGM